MEKTSQKTCQVRSSNRLSRKKHKTRHVLLDNVLCTIYLVVLFMYYFAAFGRYILPITISRLTSSGGFFVCIGVQKDNL